MATINLVLDLRRARKDLTYNLVFRITKDSKYLDVGTGIALYKHQFNQSKQLVVSDRELNDHLQNIKEEYQKRLRTYLLHSSGDVELRTLKELLTSKPKERLTVEDFWLRHIDGLKLKGSYGSANVYSMSLKGISKELDLQRSFNSIRYVDVVELETALYKRGMTANGVSVYLRSFRAICNKAIELELVSSDWYPFRKFKIKRSRTLPKVLSIEKLREYFNLNISKGSTYYQSWLIGKLIFMLRGINLKDLLLLTERNVKSDRIIYKRSKTNKLYSVKLSKEMQEVFNEFVSNSTLLGVFTNLQFSDKSIMNDVYIQKRKLINTHLKKLGRLIESEESLTTYVFRYSYANVSKRLGYSKDMIAEALGHEYGNTVTGIYLEQFDLKLIDEMNQEVINAVLCKSKINFL